MKAEEVEKKEIIEEGKAEETDLVEQQQIEVEQQGEFSLTSVNWKTLEQDQIKKFNLNMDFSNFQKKISPDGKRSYQGVFQRGDKSGFGRFETPGSTFTGFFEKNLKSGFGIEKFTNGDKYVGFYFANKFEGIGMLEFSNKNGVYKGQFRNGCREGMGEQYYQNGDYYIGHYLNDLPHGKDGEYSCLNGFLYKGEFREGFRHGRGKIYFPDGSLYEGNIRWNLKHGTGKYTNSNQLYRYNGYWKLDTMWGYGVKEFTDKNLVGEQANEKVVYQGQFVNGEFHGIGTLKYLDGSYLEGNFRNGKPKGRVVSYNKDTDSWFILDDIHKKALQNGSGYPPSKQDGQLKLISDCIQSQKKFTDKNFLLTYKVPRKFKFEKYSKRDNWERLGKLFPDGQLFSQAIRFDMFKAGPLANIEFGTCVESLCKCPDTFQSLFSEQYSTSLGFYNVFLFERGYQKNIIVDDQVPIDSLEVPLFLLPNQQNLAASVLEKAFAKETNLLYDFKNQKYDFVEFLEAHKDDNEPKSTQVKAVYEKALKMRNVEEILYKLTGFLSIKIKTNWPSPVTLQNLLIKYKDFHIKMAYPNLQTCQDQNLNPLHPYLLQEIFKAGNLPVFVFKTLKGSKKIIKTKWVEDLSIRDHNFVLEYGERVKKFTDGMFLCGYDEIHKYFDFIITNLCNPFQIIQTLSDSLHLNNRSGNISLFYMVKVNFATNAVIQIEQYINSKTTKHLPMRMIIAKNFKDKMVYVCGKGQLNQRRIAKHVTFDHGNYFIYVQIQCNGKVEDMDLILSCQASNPLKLEKYDKEVPPQFLQRVYINCAHKYGLTVDLRNEVKGSKNCELIQLFRQSDGVYLQYFKNKSNNIVWLHKVGLSYKNMQFIGFRKKNVKITNKGTRDGVKNVDVALTIRPGEEHMLLLCQQNGEPYELSGGEGTRQFTELIAHSHHKH